MSLQRHNDRHHPRKRTRKGLGTTGAAIFFVTLVVVVVLDVLDLNDGAGDGPNSDGGTGDPAAKP